jgi:hypothetical protein
MCRVRARDERLLEPDEAEGSQSSQRLAQGQSLFRAPRFGAPASLARGEVFPPSCLALCFVRTFQTSNPCWRLAPDSISGSRANSIRQGTRPDGHPRKQNRVYRADRRCKASSRKHPPGSFGSGSPFQWTCSRENGSRTCCGIAALASTSPLKSGICSVCKHTNPTGADCSRCLRTHPIRARAAHSRGARCTSRHAIRSCCRPSRSSRP